MNLETIKKAGIRFSYSRFAVFPQIPYTQDVLYILQLSDEKDAKNYYSPEGAANWSTYIENATLAAAAVAGRVLCMAPYDETETKKIIAVAIMELCPEEALCVFNNAFVDATEVATGQPAPFRTMNRETLRATCGCAECEKWLRGGYYYVENRNGFNRYDDSYEW